MAREFSVGQIAARSGVAISALHFYEREGLIRSNRTAGNQRRYAPDALRRIAVIKVGQEVGIPLAEIRAALATLPDGRTPDRKDWEKLSRGWAGDLDRRIRNLQSLRDGLDGCIGCGCLSLDKCTIFNPKDVLAEEGPGPRRLTEGHGRARAKTGNNPLT